MKRKTVVLFLGGGGSARSSSRSSDGPLGAYALEAACGHRPGRRPGPGRSRGAGPGGLGEPDQGRRNENARLPARRGKGGRAAARASSWPLVTARAVLEKYPDCDILAVPADRPLLRGRTLKALLRRSCGQGLRR